MKYFIVDSVNPSACDTCCCSAVSSAPGETEVWNLDFGAWAIPIGGKGLSETQINIEKIYTPTPSGVSVNFQSATTPINTDYAGELSAAVVNPGALALTYAILPFDGPRWGSVDINPATGAFIYTPLTGFAGWDRFFFSAKQENGQVVVGQFAIGTVPTVGTLPPAKAVPDVQILQSQVIINPRVATVKLPVEVSPAAPVGAVYRVTVKQFALDCDCNKSSNISCYDLTIGKCG